MGLHGPDALTAPRAGDRNAVGVVSGECSGSIGRDRARRLRTQFPCPVSAPGCSRRKWVDAGPGAGYLIRQGGRDPLRAGHVARSAGPGRDQAVPRPAHRPLAQARSPRMIPETRFAAGRVAPAQPPTRCAGSSRTQTSNRPETARKQTGSRPITRTGRTTRSARHDTRSAGSLSGRPWADAWQTDEQGPADEMTGRNGGSRRRRAPNAHRRTRPGRTDVVSPRSPGRHRRPCGNQARWRHGSCPRCPARPGDSA